MVLRGIRGATNIKNDEAEELLEATRELLQEMVKINQVDLENIANIFFTVTPDLKSAFPAAAARSLGWNQIPLLCLQEIEVPGALEKCIRVLMQVNTPKAQAEIRHVYLGEARKLRPDLDAYPRHENKK